MWRTVFSEKAILSLILLPSTEGVWLCPVTVFTDQEPHPTVKKKKLIGSTKITYFGFKMAIFARGIFSDPVWMSFYGSFKNIFSEQDSDMWGHLVKGKNTETQLFLSKFLKWFTCWMWNGQLKYWYICKKIKHLALKAKPKKQQPKIEEETMTKSYLHHLTLNKPTAHEDPNYEVNSNIKW